MTANPANTADRRDPNFLMDSLQSEVPTEASPLLNFLINNARGIAIFLALFLVAIIGYWVYSSQAEKQAQLDQRALGEILIIKDTAKRLERLEAYAPSAPASVAHQTWFAIMAAAGELNKPEKSFEAWKKISEYGGNIKGTAYMGMATALADQGKLKEAIDLLSAQVGNFTGAQAMTMNLRIASLAEASGDFQRAITACDALINEPELAGEAHLWRQKRAGLENSLKGGAAPVSGAAPASGTGATATASGADATPAPGTGEAAGGKAQ